MPSNLPPGCSSPDGGLDRGLEAALEELSNAVPSVECAQALALLAPAIEHVIRTAHRLGYDEGLAEGLADGRAPEPHPEWSA